MSEWKEYKLGNAPIKIIDGDRGKNYPSQDEFTSQGYCLFLSTKNVKFVGFDLSDCQFISKERDELLRKGKLEKNDIVLTTRGTIGNIGFYSEKIKYNNIRINSGMVIIRPNVNELSPSFNYYTFRHLQKDFLTFTTGSAQPQLPIRDLIQIEIKLPPLPEQTAIAEILSSLDDKIDLLHRQNKTLEQLAETLFRQWFVEEAEESWEGGMISDFTCNIQYGYTTSAIAEKGGPKFLRITDIQGGKVNWDLVPYCEINEKDYQKYLLRTGDIVVARTGASTGENIYLYAPEEAVFASYLIRIQFPFFSLARYLGVRMRSQEYFKYIEGILSGSAQPNANARELTSFEVQIPPKEKLEKFYKIVKEFDQKIFNNQKQIRILTRLLDTLLPKLMSGEVRVGI